MSGCPYCDKGESMAAIGLEVARLSVSTLYFFREQTHPGRCIVAHDRHVSEFVDLPDDERNAFFADVDRAAKVLHSIYRPGKINYGAYGDTVRHLHFHLVPKYEGGPEWGGIFVMNPQKTYLTDDGYKDAITKIRQALSR
ncbi:MAG: HIT family protein [Planctomycetota bacterium]|nr:HIT family protein [Planctomycetota bacterium]